MDDDSHLAHAALPQVRDAVRPAGEGPDGKGVRRIGVHHVADEGAEVRARDDAVAIRPEEGIVEIRDEELAVGTKDGRRSVCRLRARQGHAVKTSLLGLTGPLSCVRGSSSSAAYDLRGRLVAVERDGADEVWRADDGSGCASVPSRQRWPHPGA